MIRPLVLCAPHLNVSPFLIGVLLLLTGCKKRPTYEQRLQAQNAELAPLVEKHRAQYTAKMTTLRVAAKDAMAAPRVTTREPSSETIGASNSGLLATMTAGTLVTSFEWLVRDPADRATSLESATKTIVVLPTFSFERLDDLLVTGIYSNYAYRAGTATIVDSELSTFAKLRHAVLVRVHSYHPPTVTGSRFDRGFVEGDAIVYKLSDGTRVGAFPFETRQLTDEVYTPNGEDEATSVKRSFRREFETAIVDELVAYAANQPGPASPGMAKRVEHASFVRRIQTAITLWKWEHDARPGRVTVTMEAGPEQRIVTITVDDPKRLAVRQAEAEALVFDVLGTAAEVRIIGR